MIQETRKKLDLIAYDKKMGAPSRQDEPVPTAIVSQKYGTIVMSKQLVKETGMSGKFIRLYYDSAKKVIAWKLKDKIDQQHMKLWKLCQPNKHTGAFAIGVGKMLKTFHLKKESYKSLPVQKYRDVTGLGDAEVYYFVEVKDDIKIEVTNKPMSEPKEGNPAVHDQEMMDKWEDENEVN